MPTRVCSGSVGLQMRHRRDQLQPRAHRPLGVVLMGLRIAEVHQHAVAHVLRHEPAEALHGLGDALLIGRNDLAQVFRVHARRERRRADEVREHHRDLAALGSVLGLRLGQRRLWRCLDVTDKLRNRRQHLSSMSKRDADLLQDLDPSNGGAPRHRCRCPQKRSAYSAMPMLRQPVRNRLRRWHAHDDNSSSNALASFRSSVSKPSVNQP